MFRNLRSILSYSQVPVRIVTQQDKYKLYRVRFVPQDKRLNGFLRAFLILSACHITANTMLQIFGGGWEEPLFIPLGFAKEEPRKRYELTDPEFQAFLKFNKDGKKMRAARAKVLETLVKHLEASNKEKFGGNVKATGSILYYHYPIGPPQEYKRKGLQISPVERDASNPSAGILHPLRLSTLRYEWVSRPIPPNTMYRLSNTLYPSWVFYSLYSSVADTFNWLQALRGDGHTVDSMGGLVAVGTNAIKQGLGDTHKKLRRTWKPPPPPRGHVMIDGIVQVMGNDLLVGIDITASFDPETLDGLRFYRTEVRYVGKIKRVQKASPPPIQLQFHPTGENSALKDEGSKGGVQAALQAATELQRRAIEQQRNFIEKQGDEEIKSNDQKGVMEEPKVQEEETQPSPAKPLVQILKEKRGEPIPDFPPNEDAGKRENKKHKADADDGASPKP